MENMRIHRRVAAFASAIALSLLISPVLAGGKHDNNRPVDITFTKWITTSPAMAGFVGGDVSALFVGHIFHRDVSPNGHVVRLEAMYEVQDGDRTFAALIRGGSNPAGLGLLDGFILDGWVESISFRNSVVTITKAMARGHDKLGERVLVGESAQVQTWGGQFRAAVAGSGGAPS